MKKTNELIVVGAGGHALEVVELAQLAGWRVIGLLDDHRDGVVAGLPILGKINEYEKWLDYHFVIAVGATRERYRIASQLACADFATLIHPLSIISKSAIIGKGSVVAAGACLSSNVKVGGHCIININSSLSHEVEVSDFVTIAPNVALAGRVNVGGKSDVGLNASVKQGVTIGNGSFLGMGGVLINDMPANSVYVGNPARHLKFRG